MKLTKKGSKLIEFQKTGVRSQYKKPNMTDFSHKKKRSLEKDKNLKKNLKKKCNCYENLSYNIAVHLSGMQF